jgi:hypothetical protein
MCATLVAGMAMAPQIVTPAQQAAAADSTCVSSVPTYVWEPSSSSNNLLAPRVLHKYMDWGPRTADADLLDTLYSAPLPGSSQVFTGGGNGIIYEATLTGQVKTYKDNTATGGSLLTPVKTYSMNWSGAKRILTNGTYILVLASDGTLDVYQQSAPATGNGTITKILAAPSSITAQMAAADDVWMVNSAIWWLKDGAVHQTEMLVVPLITGPTFRLTKVTDITTGVDAAQAWSPGSDVVNTQTTTTDPDTTGQIRKYKTGPWTSLDDDIRSGIVGRIMADAGPCLADPDPNTAPYFGTPPDESGGEPATEPADVPATAPSRTVTGTFTSGNGQPAPGLPVTVTASDTDPDATGQVKETALGTAVTAADGSWSVTLPETLPADVQQAKDDNGGVLNLQASVLGTTSSGVPMLGVDPVSAVTDASADGTADDGHRVSLTPNTLTESSKDTYSADTERDTYAAKATSNPAATDDDTLRWQSDHSTLAADYNPYVVDGKDISAEAIEPPVTPMGSGGCETVKWPQDSSIKYTVVGEAHAGWDAKATFEYESSMSSSFDIAVKSNGDWSLSGSKELSGSTGVSVGYVNKGPHYAHQYKVPIEYTKYKKQYMCQGVVRSTLYMIEAKRYKAPAGGAMGKVGKDVSGKDGTANFNKSPQKNRNYLVAGNTMQLSKGRSIKFGSAVAAFGVSLGSKTGYDSNHRQRITALNKPGKHWIWGKNGPVSSGKAGVFYSK